MNNNSRLDNMSLGNWEDHDSCKNNSIQTRTYFIIGSIFIVMLSGIYFVLQSSWLVIVFYSILVIPATISLRFIYLSFHSIIVIGVRSHATGISLNTIFWKDFRDGHVSKVILIPWADIDYVSNSSDMKSAKIHIHLNNIQQITSRRTLSSFDFAHLEDAYEAKEVAIVLNKNKALFSANKIKSEGFQGSAITDNHFSWTNTAENRHTPMGNAISRRWRMFSASLVFLNVSAIAWIALVDPFIPNLTIAAIPLIMSVPISCAAFNGTFSTIRFVLAKKEYLKFQIVYWQGFKLGNTVQEVVTSWSNIKDIRTLSFHSEGQESHSVNITLYKPILLLGKSMPTLILSNKDFAEADRIVVALMKKKTEFESNPKNH